MGFESAATCDHIILKFPFHLCGPGIHRILDSWCNLRGSSSKLSSDAVDGTTITDECCNKECSLAQFDKFCVAPRKQVVSRMKQRDVPQVRSPYNMNKWLMDLFREASERRFEPPIIRKNFLPEVGFTI
ncbi:Uncharacterised protein g7352 [Pycnogonum litorale]